MSGSETVRAYRQRMAGAAAGYRRWRKAVFAIATLATVAGFGSIVVEAGDNAGVYDIAKQYTTARGTPRFQMPQMFYPAARSAPRAALSYAPVPSAGRLMALPSTGKRSLDKARRTAKAKTLPKTHVAGITSHIRGTASRSLGTDKAFQEAFLRSRTSYCVRSCDGFFFPVGNADTASPQAHEAACARACPGAQTQVYVASAGARGIEDAINRRGQRYQATQTAFHYRTQFDAACSCDVAGTPRNHSVFNDFTLRPGDMVMSREGLKVFRGTETFPYRKAHFGSTTNARLTAKERRFVQLSDAASLRGTAAAIPQTLQGRVSAQRAMSSRSLADIGLRGADTTIALSDGRQMRYVGPFSGRGELR